MSCKNAIKKALFFLLTFLLAPIYAQTSLSSALNDLCVFIKDLIPITAMLMITASGAVYAGGQFMGAETRARANVWATSMLTGAVIGILITVLVPWVLGIMLAAPVNCT